jgi:sarcosine oxidase gamma subunit
MATRVRGDCITPMAHNGFVLKIDHACPLLSRDSAIVEGVATATVSLGDGRAINVTGGACVVRIGGPQTDALLSRIGCHDSMPAPRSSRATRVADLSVVLVRTEGLDVHLLLDRVYLEHMMHWLRVSIDDVAAHSTMPASSCETS